MVLQQVPPKAKKIIFVGEDMLGMVIVVSFVWRTRGQRGRSQEGHVISNVNGSGSQAKLLLVSFRKQHPISGNVSVPELLSYSVVLVETNQRALIKQLETSVSLPA